MDLGTHHVGDIGRILRSVQDDLRSLKQNLHSADAKSGLPNNVKAILERAEADIQAKAEAVLSTALGEQFTTLPAIRREPSVRSRRPPSANRMTVKDQMQATRKAELMSNPNSNEARKFLQERFGVKAPKAPKRRKAATPKGRLFKEKTAPTPDILPRINRIDPTAPLPEVTDDDVDRGVMHLIQRGMVPSSSDCTQVFVRAPAPVLCGPVVMHPMEDKHRPTETFVGLGAGMSTLKLDVVQPATLPGTAERQRMMATTQPVRSATLTPNVQNLQVPTDFAATAPADQLGNRSPSPQAANEGWDAVDPRDYNELLDTFSLHQFIIRRGKVLSETPEFESFSRKYKVVWGPVLSVITALERLLGGFGVPIAHIDGSKVVNLAREAVGTPTDLQLLGCLVNLDQVAHLIKVPGARYKTSGAEGIAAERIQAVTRGHWDRLKVRRQRYTDRCVRNVQDWWKVIFLSRRTSARLALQRKNERQEYEARQREFCRKWPRIQQEKRVIVHIPSITRSEAIRSSLSDVGLRENAQLSRLMDVSDPNVEVVYVSPFPQSPDLVQYYAKLTAVGADPEAASRFKVLHPENFSRFPPHMSLSQVLMHSPRCLRRIKNLVRGRNAYVIPGYVGGSDWQMANRLGIPVLGTEADTTLAYCSKTGSRRIFSAADVATAPGSGEASDAKSLHDSLARLMFEHIHVERWVLKIDDESDLRGHAYVTSTDIPACVSLRRERKRNLQAWFDPLQKEQGIRRLEEDLRKKLQEVAVLNRGDLYGNWHEYIAAIEARGVVVEAMPAQVIGSPRVELFISPDGSVQILGSHDALHADMPIGITGPQTSTPHLPLMKAATNVGQMLAAKRAMGYVTVDFLSWLEDGGQPRLWGLHINPFLTDAAAESRLFRFITQAQWKAGSGNFSVPNDVLDSASQTTAATQSNLPQERYFVSLRQLYHPNLCSVQYNVFFNLCRLKGVHFDLRERVGTAFVLSDSFASGTLGILTIHADPINAFRLASTGLSFVQSQMGIAKGAGEKFLPAGTFRNAVMEVKTQLAVRSAAGDNKGDADNGLSSKVEDILP